MARGDRLIALTRARVIVPASGAVYAAGAVAHHAQTAPLEVALGSGLAAAVAYGTRARPLTGALMMAGAWVTAAARYGPLAGPDHAMTITWGAAALAALVAAHRHPSVREAREWRAARREHLFTAHRRGLGGSHLVTCEQTRLGEVRELDVTGTGRLASQVAHGSLAERIAQEEGLPLSRVQVTSPRPGRVRVAIRFTDPWQHPIPHPLLDDDPEMDLPVPCTVHRPLPVGMDPETGNPLSFTVWDEYGAKVIMVIAKRREGKTTLANCLRERVTAAADADLWNINVSKAQEDRAWAEACEHSACGPGERKKAFAILRAARKLVDERGARHREDTVFQPTAYDRLKVIIIDEIDELVNAGGPWVKAELGYIASKAGSEGVALVVIGQRATNDWMGGGSVKANIEYVALGKVNSFGEINHAAGGMAVSLPDMTSYGEGHKGVWVIAEHGGDAQAGRAFSLCELTGIRAIAAQRSRRVPAMAGAGDLPASNLLAGNNFPAMNGNERSGEPAPAEPPRGGDEELLRHLDGEVMGGLPDDLREQLGKISARNADTQRILNEPAPVLPEVDQEAKARSTAERWRQVGEQAVIPPEIYDHLLSLLGGEGTTIKRAAAALNAKPWPVRCWLEKLRQDGTARIDGKGRGAKWCLAADTDGDDG